MVVSDTEASPWAANSGQYSTAPYFAALPGRSVESHFTRTIQLSTNDGVRPANRDILGVTPAYASSRLNPGSSRRQARLGSRDAQSRLAYPASRAYGSGKQSLFWRI